MENKMLAALYANFQKERQAEWEAAKARAVKAAAAAMEKKREREGRSAAATATAAVAVIDTAMELNVKNVIEKFCPSSMIINTHNGYFIIIIK